MWRKTVIALLAVAAVGSPTLASARSGGFGGHGGFHDGFDGFHGGPGLAVGPEGLGVYASYPYGAYGYHFGYFSYPYPYHVVFSDYYDDDGGCYLVRRRAHTRHGWRPVEVCD